MHKSGAQKRGPGRRRRGGGERGRPQLRYCNGAMCEAVNGETVNKEEDLKQSS